MSLVQGSFTGVRATWWWERRMGGGIEVCQELDPQKMASDLAQKTGREAPEVRGIVAEELGLEDDEPVVLTFEIGGEVTVADAAKMLSERSSTPEGLASGLYQQIEAAVTAE